MRAVDVPNEAVYVGRPSKWGNPYGAGDGDRDVAIAQYELWLDRNPGLLAQLEELRGKDLVCWCAPLRCHGDVLIQKANN